MTPTPRPIQSAFRQAISTAWAGGSGMFLPLGFYFGAAAILPLAIGHESETLSQIAPGLVWVLLALASLVTLERLFQADLEDGSLELWMLAGTSPSLIALAKTIANWIVAGLPLAVLAPVLLMMFHQPPGTSVPQIVFLYAAGSLAFFLWGGVSAALSASVSRGGLLISLLALPLYVPTAIFGALAMRETAFSESAPLFLIASTLFALAIAPFAMAAALRLAVD